MVKKTITIVDVAEKAGVSKTTISRYLNGKYEFMSQESRERIAKVIEEMGYRPNNLARGLKSKRSRLIGVLVSDIGSPFSSILLKGIGDCCERYGYGVLITNSNDNPKKERDYILSMIDQRVEGLIINTTGQNDEFLQQVVKNGVPIVLADRPMEEHIFDTVRTADEAITMDVMRHLKERGFKKVGWFSQVVNNETRKLRSAAYREACHAIMSIDPQEYVLDDKDPKQVEDQIRSFIEANGKEKKAIYTGNGVATLHVVKALQRMKLRFPQDLGLCGFNNWDWTELVGGGITVVSQPSYRVGHECVKRIMARIHRNRHAKAKLIELECKLIIRSST
jgi:LacI family kdg operon repressor